MKLVLFMLFLSSSLSSATAQSELARLQLEDLVQHWSQLDTTAKQEFLENCLEFGAETYSDYWLALSSVQASYEKRVAALEQALSLGNWLSWQPQTATQQLAELLFLTQRYAKLWQLYQTLSFELRHSGKTPYYALSALKKLGKDKEAARLAKNLLQEYPHKLTLFSLFAPEQLNSEFLTLLMQSYSYVKNPDKIVLKRLIEKSSRAEDKQAFLHIYNLYWSNDDYSAYQQLSLHDNFKRERLEYFRQNYKSKDFKIVWGWFQQSFASLAEKQRLQWLEGTFELDKDYDGYLDEMLTFNEGSLKHRRVIHHDNQVWQLDLYFDSAGQLSEAMLQDESKKWQQRLFYSSYPELKSFTVQTEQQNLIYSFAPKTMQVRLSDSAPLKNLAWVDLFIQLPELKLSQLTKKARLIETYKVSAGKKILKTRVQLTAEGLLRVIKSDQDGDGRLDSITLPYEEQALPQWQSYAQRLDLDADGYFETRQLITKDKVSLLEIDLDNDRQSDYLWS